MKNYLMLLVAVVLGFSTSAAVVHVSTSGNDTDGDGSAAKPYATIQKGADSAEAGDTIKIAGGLYSESVTLHTYRHVSGSWNSDFTAQDLRNGRTVIRSTANSKPAISIPSETGTNVIDALTLTGGSAGLQSRAKGGANDNSTYNMPLTRLIVTNNVNGLDFNGGFNGAKMISCLVAKNSGKGYHHNANHGTLTYALNCTFAENGQAIYREGAWVAAVRARNCIFLKNTTAIHTTTDYSKPSIDRTLFYDNGVRERWTSGTLSNWTASRYLVGILFGDPKLGDDYAPQTGSAAIGRGLDSTVPRTFEGTTVPAGMPTVASDVYGESFDGTDLGCVKASVAEPTRIDNVYVATTGDDANTGADAAHPKKSINNAVALLADGGTCHVADGTYVEAVSLGVTNMTLLGESVAGTIIKSETGTDGQTKDFAVGVFAPNVTVSNLTCAASGAGVQLSASIWEIPNPKIVRTVLTGNCRGFFQTGTTRSDCKITLSHSQVRDSLVHGVSAFNVMRLDNVLIADNAQCGIHSDTWNNSGSFYMNNVTITGNGTYGYYFNNTWSPSVYCYNSIVHNNGTQGIYAAKSGFNAYKCCFYGNGNDNANTGVTDQKVGGVTSCIYTDPLVDLTATLRGHLAEGSPCAQTGGDYSAISQAPSTTDLDYMKRLTDKMDMGCYISPETMNDLAGQGYHIINVEGDPNGYGTVTPAYGRKLLEDGALRLDARGTLYTEELDGVRASQVVDGTEVTPNVRAAYKGYAYTEEGDADSKYASDTAEYLDVTFVKNATMSWKWERQNRIVVSTDAPGCKVKINDGAPAACVTNWIAQGEEYTVSFIPTSDFEFDSWSGEFPSTADPRYQTTTVASDMPRSLVPRYRKLIHVATTGDDGTGLGTTGQPYATIAKAIAVANARDVIYVQKGTYNESVVNSSVNNLTIAGGYDASWQRDLVNAQTFVIPPSGSDCVVLQGVVSNVVKGLVLTGGRYGVRVKTGSGLGQNTSAAYRTSRYHDLSQLIITNNTKYGVYAEDVSGCGFRLVSSLVARNKSHGVYVVANWTCGACLFNCTIVDNGENGLFTGSDSTAYDIRNCLIAANASHSAYSHDSGSHQVLAAHNLFYRPSGYAVHWNGGTIITGGGNLFLEPKTNANWTIAADSPCVASGYNLHADPRCAMLEDVYGTPWNGVYDIGCFKSVHKPVEKLDDVYVSPDGDDTNSGADAAQPLKTPALGALRLADGGTLHFAAGTYTTGFSITAAGATVRGAGSKETVFTVGSNTKDLAGRFAIDIAADGVTVEHLSAKDGAGNGINLACNAFARKIVVRDCAFTGCYIGVRCHAYYYSDLLASLLPEDKGESSATWAYHRLSRCVISDNVTRGIDVSDAGYTAMRGDNLLIARNGTDGIHCRDRNGSLFYVESYFYYCTIADNGGHGVYNYNNGDYGRPYFYNCIFTGNAVGISRSRYDDVIASHCVVSGNDRNFADDYGQFGSTNGTTTAEMRYKGSSYRPARDAVALGLARALTASDKIAEPETDLLGRSRYNQRHERDSGCYVRDLTPFMILVR